MKLKERLYKLFIVLILCLLIVSCNTSDDNNTVIENEYFLIQDDSKNAVSIKMPMFSNIEINEMLEGHIKEYFVGFYALSLDLVRSDRKAEVDINNIQYAEYFIDLDYRIAYNSESLISIVWEGLGNNRNAAHPNNILITYNLNPNKVERVLFSDDHIITKELYNEFVKLSVDSIAQKTTNGTYPEEWGAFSEDLCTWEAFENGMKNETEFCLYYSDKGVSVVYPVSHSLGDYFVTSIPYDILEYYKK